MRVYEAIAAALKFEGCSAFFGVMGDGNMSIWAALAADPSIAIYSARHEAAAVAMADGYARVHDGVGVALVTCGPGLTQVGTSLVAAVRNRTPTMILVVGEFPVTNKSKTQWIEQRPFVEACGALYHSINSKESVADDIAEAFYAARTDRCPVALNVPMPLQGLKLDWDLDYRPSTLFTPAQIRVPTHEILVGVADRLLAAERPVLLAGRGAQAARATRECMAVADQVGRTSCHITPGKGHVRWTSL